MSAQRLTSSKIRKIAKDTHLPVTRGWDAKPNLWRFVAIDPKFANGHVHGDYRPLNGAFRTYPDSQINHYTSCSDLTDCNGW